MKSGEELTPFVKSIDAFKVIRRDSTYSLDTGGAELSLLDCKSGLLEILKSISGELSLAKVNLESLSSYNECVQALEKFVTDHFEGFSNVVSNVTGLFFNAVVKIMTSNNTVPLEKKMVQLTTPINNVIFYLSRLQAEIMDHNFEDGINLKCQLLNQVERVNKITFYLLTRHGQMLEKTLVPMISALTGEALMAHNRDKNSILSGSGGSLDEEQKSETKSDAEKESIEQGYNNTSWLEVLETVANANTHGGQPKM